MGKYNMSEYKYFRVCIAMNDKDKNFAGFLHSDSIKVKLCKDTEDIVSDHPYILPGGVTMENIRKRNIENLYKKIKRYKKYKAIGKIFDSSKTE